MGFTCRVDHDRRELHTTATDPISLSNIADHLAMERREGGLLYAQLIDARTAAPGFTSTDIRAVVSLVRDLAARRLHLGPTAVVVSSDAGYGMVRMLQMLIEDICAVHPFRDMEAARQWLQEDARGEP